MFLFGGQKVYRHFFSQDKNVESYSSKDIETRLGEEGEEGGWRRVGGERDGGETRGRSHCCRLSTLLEFLSCDYINDVRTLTIS